MNLSPESSSHVHIILAIKLRLPIILTVLILRLKMYKVLFSILLLPACEGFKIYQDRIPNGNHIPHPCKPNYIWHGVGHQNSQGGGVRNAFGKDFQANEKVYGFYIINHNLVLLVLVIIYLLFYFKSKCNFEIRR